MVAGQGEVNLSVWPSTGFKAFEFSFSIKGNSRVMTIFHPGKPGWTVYMRNFKPGLSTSRQLRPGSRQAGQAAFSYKRTEL